MTLQEIISIANDAYPDGRIAQNFNPKTGHATKDTHGDGLANFIVRELCDTFDPNVTTDRQLAEAHRTMRNARRELESVEERFNQ